MDSREFVEKYLTFEKGAMHVNGTGIYSVNEFRKILSRERARADRNGHCFSVVVFDFTKSGNKGRQEFILINSLNNRVRETDVVGWFKEDCVGLLLYDVEAIWAERIAGEICKGLQLSIQYQVYTYPYHYLNPVEKKELESPQTDRCMKKINELQYEMALTDGSSLNDSWDLCKAICERPDKSNNNIEGLEPIFGKSIPVWKRTFDFLAAGLGLILLFPLFLVIGALIKIVSPGPIFFTQERVGYLGKRFTLWKFRTMKVNNDVTKHKDYLHDLMKNGRAMKKLEHDPQIIPFGRFLRSTGLDELPQLINVLRGEMSIIGPRPPIPYEVEEYTRWFHGRFDTMPGLTGLWQVSGKNRLSFTEMIRLDIQYKRKLSFLSDLSIILKTPYAIWSQIVDKS